MNSILEEWVKTHAQAWGNKFYFTYNSDVPTERNGTPVFYEIPYNGKLVCAVHRDFSEELLEICSRNQIRLVYINVSELYREGFLVRAGQPKRVQMTDRQMMVLLEVMQGRPLVCQRCYYLVRGEVLDYVQTATVKKLMDLNLLEWDGDYLVPTGLAWQEYGHLISYPKTPISRFRRQAERVLSKLADYLMAPGRS